MPIVSSTEIGDDLVDHNLPKGPATWTVLTLLERYNKQCIHKNWQSYTQINRGTICAKELPFRVQPFRGVNCGLIPYIEAAIESET